MFNLSKKGDCRSFRNNKKIHLRNKKGLNFAADSRQATWPYRSSKAKEVASFGCPPAMVRTLVD